MATISIQSTRERGTFDVVRKLRVSKLKMEYHMTFPKHFYTRFIPQLNHSRKYYSVNKAFALGIRYLSRPDLI
jgi:hypothetical protein